MTQVQIAYIHGENVTHSFHHSIMRLANSPNSHLYTKTTVSASTGALNIPEARNELMRYFLDETDASHIWWIDTDMGFGPNTVEELLEPGLDVIGAVCKGLMHTEPDGFGGYKTEEFITAYDLATVKVNDDTEIMSFVLKEGLDLDSTLPIPVAGTGTGCLLISRHAALVVRNLYGPRWFERVTLKSPSPNILPRIVGEDLSFCYRLATVGIKVYIHPQVRTTHAKTVWVK